ncbi:hypothetical protein [cyanobacterium endosymbiont of Epithemia clementina EcSB]|uniref:hypothetical protein n=1 Tax=cyanobacterium endosymbiont of Epithemia clementina EcSB TaxID=3034674 RepID=UPI002481382C|nr:hypothetical protein [cyanobacterium endosymbiont of Epithemia clementina EcSB]WGT66989.1 hypothetical protein P3F56_07055 [cyanobacterium endosymbiont of Epithemia clementina EcSB]
MQIVANGSSDHSSILTKQAGVEVIFKTISGYRKAYWTGLHNLSIVFITRTR